MTTFTKTVLKNGLRIITVPQKDSANTMVMVLAEAGSHYEDKANNGVSHFLEHLCFKGTSNRPSSKIINQELDAMGSASNAFTGEQYTGYWAKAHHSKTDKMLEIISDLFLNPLIPAEEMEKEKGVIIEEINMYEDMPMSKVLEVYNELVYGDTAFGRSIAGTKENIKKMTRDEVLKYRNEHYKSGAITVVVAGKINEKKIITQIEKIFAGVSKGKAVTLPKITEKQTAPAIKLFNKKTDQTHLVLGFRSFKRGDKKNYTLSLLSTILGGGMSSRLFQKMREELGICYYAKSGAGANRVTGQFFIRAGVNNERVEEALRGILAEVRKMSTELVGTEELQKAKDYQIGHLFLGLETADAWGEFFGFQELLHDKKIETPDDIVKKIQKISAKEIQKVAQEILKNETLNLAMIGDFKPNTESKIINLLSL